MLIDKVPSFQRPIPYVGTAELLIHVKAEASDAAECRRELHRRGWDDEKIHAGMNGIAGYEPREHMTGAEIVATRHLIGLSQSELAEQLNVGRDAVKDWERDRFRARPGVVDEIRALRYQHDKEARRTRIAARDGQPVELPSGPMPRGWYAAIGARVLDAAPQTQLSWAIDDD